VRSKPDPDASVFRVAVRKLSSVPRVARARTIPVMRPLCSGLAEEGCGDKVTCAVCEHCEAHCLVGGSGACATAAWPRDKVEQAVGKLASENGFQRCGGCGGLEALSRRPQQCRVGRVMMALPWRQEHLWTKNY